MKRRNFIKVSCTLCVGVGAGLGMMELFTSCSQMPIYKTDIVDKTIKIPESLFAESQFQRIRPKGLGYDIGLKKEDDGNYQALLLRCTHADNPLTVTGNGYVCNLHGSRFDSKGNVLQGPAETPLKSYSVAVANGEILIKLI